MSADQIARPRPAAQRTSRLGPFRLSTVTETRLPLARAWRSESRYSHLPFSEKKFLGQVAATLNHKVKGAAFFVIRGTEVAGIINLAVGEAWPSVGGCYATCLAWFIDPKVRRTLLGGRVAALLFDQAKVWAKSAGAVDLLVHGTHGEPSGLTRRGVVIGSNLTVSLE